MVIFDTNNEIVESPDLTKGEVDTVTVSVVHRWVWDTDEDGHWETVAEYPNGGRDVEWVVDTEATGHWETLDSEGNPIEHFDGAIPEDLPKDVDNTDVWVYGVYTAYSEEELSRIQRQNAISELKSNLNSTDYIMVKISEYMATGQQLSDDEAERYADIIIQRRQWREEINALEAEEGGE